MGKNYSLLVTIACIFLLSPAFAQDGNNNKWAWGVYAGNLNYNDTEVNKFDFIRGTIGNYEGLYLYGDICSWNTGINMERDLWKEKLFFTVGAHFRGMQSSLDPESYSSSNFMMINISENLQDANYVRITGIDQHLSYLGAQFDIKYHFLKARHNDFSFFIGSGVEFNFLVMDNVDVGFYSDDMNKYQHKIENLFDAPSGVFSTLNFLAGLAMGKSTKPHMTLEIGPGTTLFGGTSSFVSASGTFNCKINIFVPF